MKYLILIVLLAVVFYILGQRRQRPSAPPAAEPPPRPPQAMLSCAHCGLHLPGSDALPGRGGVFCSAEHRTAFEAVHGKS